MYAIVCVRDGVPTSAIGKFLFVDQAVSWLRNRGYEQVDCEAYSPWTYSASEDRLYITYMTEAR